MFLKLYDFENDVYANDGGSCGAVDPKTFCQWSCSFVSALVELG